MNTQIGYRMHVIPEILDAPDEVGRAAARTIADGIAEAGQAGRRYLLGCPTGRSPRPVYQALTAQVRERGLDLRHVVVVLMDEYLERTAAGALRRVGEHLPYSCAGYAQRQIAGPLGRAGAHGGEASGPEVWLPDPDEADAYDERIRAYGGIDLFILASGASDGHIAFNPPGSPRDSITRVVELGETTRQDNLVSFPDFPDLHAVPTHGISVGISTIADLSKEVIMVLHGPDKARAYRRLRAAADYDPDWPATIVAACRRPRILADLAATSGETFLTTRP